MSWLDRYRAAVEEALGRPVDLDAGQEATLLDLARDVAHGTQRTNAPLATFLAGQLVAGRSAAGGDADDALAEALQIARRLLADQPG